MSHANDPLYRTLRNVALVLGVAWVGWAFYDSYLVDKEPGTMALAAAERYYEDGRYTEALTEYGNTLKISPGQIGAIRGQARTLLVLGRLNEALERYDEAIARDPGFAGQYANRGILLDRMGHYEEALEDYEHALELDPEIAALEDYEHALELDPEIAEGIHWLTRFLRNQSEKPPTIADRAAYLSQELAKPEAERLLRVPEEDEAQRPHKM